MGTHWANPIYRRFTISENTTHKKKESIADSESDKNNKF